MLKIFQKMFSCFRNNQVSDLPTSAPLCITIAPQSLQIGDIPAAEPLSFPNSAATLARSVGSPNLGAGSRVALDQELGLEMHFLPVSSPLAVQFDRAKNLSIAIAGIAAEEAEGENRIMHRLRSRRLAIDEPAKAPRALGLKSATPCFEDSHPLKGDLSTIFKL